MTEQPIVEIYPDSGGVVVNGTSLGQVLDLKIHETDLQNDFLQVTVTMLPSKLVIAVEPEAARTDRIMKTYHADAHKGVDRDVARRTAWAEMGYSDEEITRLEQAVATSVRG